MGSNFNFMNFGNDPPAEGGNGGRPPGNFPLTRQSSIYSLTFDEFQSAVGGGVGKDFGSMNMDELLKNIWSAEENQNLGSTSGAVNSQEGSGYLQRQGSLTLPRTLSQKTVDEVWRGVSKEYGNGKDASGSGVSGGFIIPQRQLTLGEVTLEEFLVRAGVVREETLLAAKPNNVGYFSDLSRPLNSSGLEFGYQQGISGAGLIGNNRIAESTNQIAVQPANLPLNVNGVRSATQQPVHQQHRQQQQLLPKQPASAYGAPMIIQSSQLGSPGIKTGIVGISDSPKNDSAVQHVKLQGGGLGMVNLGANLTVSPAISSDGLTKSNGDTSSVSPVPYVFNGGIRGRKRAALEKVIERRQRRMIKNRESAARSRARKQAYTMELEAEIAKLKEENDELRKKQAEVMEMQKNQVLEMMNQQKGSKRRCLRRTQTGPW